MCLTRAPQVPIEHVPVSDSPPDQNDLAPIAISVLIVGLAFAIVNFPSVSTWAGFGSALRQWLSDPVRLKWFNITMALLLVASLWPMLR